MEILSLSEQQEPSTLLLCDVTDLYSHSCGDIIPIMKMHNNQLNLIVFIFSQSEIKTFNCHISG